jgi:hypothetical protein
MFFRVKADDERGKRSNFDVSYLNAATTTKKRSGNKMGKALENGIKLLSAFSPQVKQLDKKLAG